MNDNSTSIFSNFVWKFLERFGAQGVTVVVSIVLARILAPSAYGTVALITVFTNILNVFVEGGMGSALIQKKDVDNVEFSSVFFLNILVSCMCYMLMFATAPFIANYYNDMELVPMIRVLSLIVIISGVKNIQQAYISRNLLFKKFFFATLGGTVSAAIVGITLAILGYGAWALVAQYLVNAAIDTFVLWLTVKWRPNFVFSFTRIKNLFSYGWKLMVGGIIYAFYNDFRQLIIGKKYSTSDLAYYDKAYTFPRYLVQLVNNTIDSVIFPVMSKQQDDKGQLLMLAKRTITLSTYIMFPLMTGLFVCANSVILIILTDKWLPCVPYLRAFCIVCAFWSFDTANQNILKAIGRSQILLVVEIIETVINLGLLLLAMNYGAYAIAIAWCISVFMNHIIISMPSRKIIGYGYLAQIKDVLPNLFITLLMGIVVWLFSYIRVNKLVLLIMQIFVGAFIYIVLSILTKNESFNILIMYIGSFKRTKNKE